MAAVVPRIADAEELVRRSLRPHQDHVADVVELRGLHAGRALVDLALEVEVDLAHGDGAVAVEVGGAPRASRR
jgi:hypothetical protein